ncbi:condensation domain-containing protein, partial [Ruminiclostridium cellobioparum]|uniref:condensation domain-containing protein n=1 Tax=Ruminiclostridium cellobioparum TaxID=29355 RepID=UPI0005545AD7
MNNKVDMKKIYNLSPMQEGILFHALMDKESDAYLIQNVFYIKGYLDITIFEKSLNIIIERHDILRTSFVYEFTKNPKQVVMENRNLKINYIDISSYTENGKNVFVEEYVFNDRQKKFDLTRDILIRMSIVKTSENSFVLIWDSHHILMDGWCLGILINELFEIYQSQMNDRPLRLGEPYSYIDYIRWLKRQDKELALSYWKEYL